MKIHYIRSSSIFKLSFLIVLLDQISKYLALKILSISNYTIIPDLIRFNLAKNTGAAFSLFSNSTKSLTLVSFIVVTGIIAYLYINAPFKSLRGYAIGLILGGAIGNFIDRLRLGFVIDFIEIIPVNFPIFNIADIAINLSLILLLLEAYNRRNEL